MIRALLIGCLLLLSACASQPPLPATTPSLPLPLQLHVPVSYTHLTLPTTPYV